MSQRLFQDPPFRTAELTERGSAITVAEPRAEPAEATYTYESLKCKDVLQRLLGMADIEVNGNKPHDIQVKEGRFYQRVLKEGSLGLGESYMDGWWECDSLDEFFSRLLLLDPERMLKKNLSLWLFNIKSLLLNLGSRSRSFRVGEKHYDLGNELYRNMLDKRMVYSCAYWNNAANLDDAQEAKLELICRKLGLKAGDRVLDIGCGWGSFAKYAAEKYGAHVVGVTVSKEQAAFGREICSGLPVELRIQDYREISEKFDHIVSVGMFEHVGYKNYRTYMEVANNCLKDKGLFLLHTIGNGTSQYSGDMWVNKYIFPNSMIPSVKQISAAAEELFVIEDFHNFGTHYDTTLCSWYENFERNWDKIKERYDKRFYRMWKYYLKQFSGVFRSRHLHVWQFVFSKEGVPGGYHAVR